MPSVLNMITDKDRLDFSQNYSIQRNYLGDILFPDIKTENLEAEYERLSEGMELPTAAMVHAFDTEAAIGVRPSFEKITVEKLLIKEKINQSERLAHLLNRGVRESRLVDYVYDDMNNLANSVKTRTEIAKMEVMATGKMTIKENNLDMEIDYGVNKFKDLTGWEDPTHDIISDIEEMVAMARAAGYSVNAVLTSDKALGYMRKNTGIVNAINGVNGARIVTKSQVETLLNELFGISTVTTNEAAYGIPTSDNKGRTAVRFFPEDKFTLYQSGVNGRVGSGLWGVTPEEERQGAFTDLNMKQFITISQWATPDPVAEWTKASGVFIPVLPNPFAMVIGTIGEEVVDDENGGGAEDDVPSEGGDDENGESTGA